MKNDSEERPKTANENAFTFLSIMGGMMRRGQTHQAETLAELLKDAARSHAPGLEAREIAAAAKAWGAAFADNPAFATRLAGRVIDGASATMQARFDMPPTPQPQRRAAAPKPRAP